VSNHHALGSHNKGKKLLHRQAEEQHRVHDNMESKHQACFDGPKMEPALIGSGLVLGFAMAEPRLCAAPRSGRHGNQWEEGGEDKRINNIDQSEMGKESSQRCGLWVWYHKIILLTPQLLGGHV
jgi:hypothetical protein